MRGLVASDKIGMIRQRHGPGGVVQIECTSGPANTCGTVTRSNEILTAMNCRYRGICAGGGAALGLDRLFACNQVL